MAGWPDIAEDDDQLVAEIVTTTKGVRARWITWRDQITATGTTSGQVAMERYQELTAYRAFMSAKVAANASGIAAAYLRRRPSLINFDPAARWAEQKATIDSFVTWFKGSWPFLTPQGHPAFARFKSGTDELEDLPLTLTTPQKTAILAQINPVVAAFTSS